MYPSSTEFSRQMKEDLAVVVYNLPMTTEHTPEHPTLVGIAEIASRLGVSRTAVDGWRHRSTMPEPRWLISGTPVWDWEEDIYPWARKTRKLDPDSLYAIPPDILGMMTPDQIPTLKRKVARRG
jgi:hypothetical protein